MRFRLLLLFVELTLLANVLSCDQPTLNAGDECDPDQIANRCVFGSSCVAPLLARAGRCLPDGSSGSRCRPMGTACDPGLACTGPQDSSLQRCRPALAIGEACMRDEGPEARTVCAEGSSCETTNSISMGVCVAHGAQGGRCRRAGNECDAGLACNAPPNDRQARCRNALPMGATCDLEAVLNTCNAPYLCQQAMGSATASCTLPAYDLVSVDSPTFIDACEGGQRIAFPVQSIVPTRVRDDGYANSPVPIPFRFSLFGIAQSSLRISINGHAVFSSTPVTGAGLDRIPNASTGAVVAPFWQDLKLRDRPFSDVCVRTLGDEPNRRLVVQWFDATDGSYDGDRDLPFSVLNFELILHEQGNAIDFLYQRLEAGHELGVSWVDGTRASIGLQSAMGRQFLRHRGTVRSNSGLLLRPR